MSRFYPKIARQAALLCQDNKQGFLLLKNSSLKYALPTVNLEEGQTFTEAIQQLCSENTLKKAQIKGVAEVKIGRIKQMNFYRCVFFATITNPNMDHFYPISSELDVEEESRRSIEAVLRRKKVGSLSFFREGWKESAPRDPSVNVMISI